MPQARWLTSANGYIALPGTEREQVGFRVVQTPEPSAVALLALGGIIAGRRQRR